MPAIVQVESISDISDEGNEPAYELGVRFGDKPYKTRTVGDKLAHEISQGQISIGDETSVLLSGTNEFVSSQGKSRNVLRSAQKR